MPNRVLRESILDSQRVDKLTPHAEVFYRRLMSVVDDFGRFDARPSVLKARCYPLKLDEVREADISRWTAECEKAGLIVLFSHQGKPYLWFKDLGEPRAKSSKYPAPPADVSLCAQTPSNDSACAHLRADVPYSGSYSDSNSEIHPTGARDPSATAPEQRPLDPAVALAVEFNFYYSGVRNKPLADFTREVVGLFHELLRHGVAEGQISAEIKRSDRVRSEWPSKLSERLLRNAKAQETGPPKNADGGNTTTTLADTVRAKIAAAGKGKGSRER